MSDRICAGDGTGNASTFCLGTIGWGTKLRGDELARLYDAFRAAGGNSFDSAHVYASWLDGGEGASERALGEIVRRRGDRANVVLATKGGHPNLAGKYPRPDRYLAPEVVARDLAESLERLRVDAVDLYFLHRDDPRVPVGEIVDALDEHVESGHARALGASNWTTARIAAANKFAAARGRCGFVASQVKFSLAVPKPSKDPTVPLFGDEEIAWHARTGLAVCAYSSTANGYFATNGVKGGGGWDAAASAQRLRRAKQLAAEMGVTPNQVALAWLLHQPFPVFPILGTGNAEHLADAMAARSVPLSPERFRLLACGVA